MMENNNSKFELRHCWDSNSEWLQITEVEAQEVGKALYLADQADNCVGGFDSDEKARAAAEKLYPDLMHTLLPKS